MVELDGLIRTLIDYLCDEPSTVEFTKEENEDSIVYIIYGNKKEVSYLIGNKSKTLQAIKVICFASVAKNPYKRIKIKLKNKPLVS